MPALDRRTFLETAAALGLIGPLAASLPGLASTGNERAGAAGMADTSPAGAAVALPPVDEEITPEHIRQAEIVLGLEFTEEQREMMVENLTRNRESASALRDLALPNHVAPSIVFDPHAGGEEPHRLEYVPDIEWTPDEGVRRPPTDEDLAFMSVTELSSLLKARRVTSVELTELYLERLARLDGALEAVVTLTPERAMRQARAADAELAAGHWRGPLHGIPWGAKDLLAVRGYPTTWGAAPYREQELDTDAEVVRRLDAAGAVLVAKLTLGALAMGDVWFGGRTNNPWNVDEGSSGSSAGPGAAVAAGLVGFAIGSETLGSIVSPSTRNGVTGHRPTFGRVGRTGAMTLSWTMDKLGPMCRSAEDCALVFSAIHGRDPGDPASITTPFSWPPKRDATALRIGYVASAFAEEYGNHDADEATLDALRSAGVELHPVAFPDAETGAMLLMLTAEAAAAFDQLTLSGRTDELVRQDDGAWPNTFRSGRFIPAVEYINASRARSRLMADMRRVFQDVDVVLAPTFNGDGLRITNLTGHPCLTIPNGFDALEDDPDSDRRRPRSITLIGALHADAEVLAVGSLIQSQTDFHTMRPPVR